MGSVLIILILVAMLATFVALAVGMLGFARGGKFNERRGNKMMQMRIVLQAVALALVALFMLLAG